MVLGAPPQPPPGFSLNASGGAPPDTGGAFDYDDLKALVNATGDIDPKYAGILARIALAESGGNPQSNRSGATSYQEGGRTYYPQGLWQISTIHGYGEDQFSALNNVRRAVTLFNEQGFGPWEASRHGGAGGGWGQYLPEELGLDPNARSPFGGGQPALVGNYNTPGSLRAPPGYTLNAPAQATPSAPPGYKLNTPGGQPSPPAGYTLNPQPGATPQYQTGGVDVRGGLTQFGQAVTKAVSDQPVGRGTWLAREQTELLANWDWITKHKVESLFNLLGTSSRMGMFMTTEGIGDIEKGDFMGAVKGIWHSIWDADQHEMDKLTRGTEEHLRQIPGVSFLMPTHAAIERFVKQYVHDPGLQGQATTILQAGEDFAAQSAVDPLTWTPFAGAKAAEMLNLIHPMFAAGKLATEVWKAADAAGLGAYFRHIKTLDTTYGRALRDVGKSLELFQARPDLNILSKDMKKIRMQDENRADAMARGLKTTDEGLEAGDTEGAKQAFLKYYGQYGSKDNVSEAIKLGYKGPTGSGMDAFKGTTAGTSKLAAELKLFMKRKPGDTDEQLLSTQKAALQDLRHIAERGENRRLTTEAINKYGTPEDKKLLKEDPKLRRLQSSNDLFRKGSMNQFPFLKMIRDWQRKAIMWNPLPHTVKNVGQLAFLAGGPRVLMDGFKYAMKGLTKDQMLRLKNIGADPAYLSLERGGGITGTISKILRPAADRFEYGWRQALLDSLDRRKPSEVGKMFDKDELLKGFMVADRLGDYHNQNAFVRMLETLGGPFVAFRMGIVPRNVFHAIRENPGRVLGLVRAEYDYNRNRPGAGKDELEFGGPAHDFASLLFPPWDYLRQTFGAMAMGGPQYGQETIGKRLLQGAAQYVPGVSAGEDLWRIWSGHGFPGPRVHGHPTFTKMSLSDKISSTFLMAFGMYYHKVESPKTMKQIKNELRKLGLFG